MLRGKKQKHVLVAMAAASGLVVAMTAPDAAAQSVTCCAAGLSAAPGPGPSATTPMPTIPPAATIPTPPPVVIITPTPPPVVDVRPTPTPPPGMFTNVPSDMRRMTQFDTVTSINRLSEPGTINFSIPRQAVRNKLENRTVSGSATGIEPDRAIQVLESAKPLI